MRRLVTLGFGIATLFVATGASAVGGVSGKGDTGNGKGGVGPQNSTQSGAAGTAEEPPFDPSQAAQTQFGGKSTQNPDVVSGPRPGEKRWWVSGTWETHRLLRQAYVDSGNAFKTMNLLFVTAGYNLTPQDSVFLSGGMTQYFFSDATESGVRADDLSVAYSHTFRLPARFLLRGSGALTVPISYSSQLESNITTPSASLSLSRQFGDLLVQATMSGRYFWDKYTSENSIGAGNGSSTGTGSGQPNVEWLAGGGIGAEYNMPFHRPLSVGVQANISYTWFYNVGSPPLNTTFPGATTNPATDGQPTQESYGGEVYVHYVLPDVSGFRSDIQLALANGDQGVGYVSSMLGTGIVHPYLLYYNKADVYIALTGRY